MVFPGVRLEGPARVCFAGNGDSLALGVEPQELLGGYDELNLRSRLPECLRELMGKEQGIVAVPGGKGRKGGLGAAPMAVDFSLVPLAQLKAVRARLHYQQMEKVFLCHRRA